MIDSPLDDIQWVDDEVAAWCSSTFASSKSCWLLYYVQVVFVISEKGDLYRSDTAGRAWTIQTPRLCVACAFCDVMIQPQNISSCAPAASLRAS
jgi:hypothetical protein